MWTEWFYPGSASALLWVLVGSVAMYLVLLGFARLAGVRSFAEMSAFDVAVTIAVGSLLATTVATPAPSVLQGGVALGTLFAIQLGASWLRIRFPRVTQATDNTPILLVGPGGRLKPEGMRVARVTESDLRSQLRAHNVLDLAEVQAVVIEGTGKINVVHGHGRAAVEGLWVFEDVRDYDAQDR